MRNHALISSSLSMSLMLGLIACSNNIKLQDEPTYYQQVNTGISIPYLALAFPAGKPEVLALQLALVKHKNKAADKERWLLLQNIPYRWLNVEWRGEELHLLAVGPYNIGLELAAQRNKLQQYFDGQLPMPAVALYFSSDLENVTQAVAKRVQKFKPSL